MLPARMWNNIYHLTVMALSHYLIQCNKIINFLFSYIYFYNNVRNVWVKPIVQKKPNTVTASGLLEMTTSQTNTMLKVFYISTRIDNVQGPYAWHCLSSVLALVAT